MDTTRHSQSSSKTSTPNKIAVIRRHAAALTEKEQRAGTPAATSKTRKDVAFRKLAKSKFRSRFRLSEEDRKYIADKGLATIRRHAEDFIRTRLAPANPPNDGRQTPMRGHPVFKAQHATATCCRGCLHKWWKVPMGTDIPPERQRRIVDFLMAWIERQLGNGTLQEIKENPIMATTLSQEEIKSFKGRGWLLNKGTDTFSARIITANGKVSADQLHAVAEAARKFGTGEVAFTSRQTIEALGVPADKTAAFEAELASVGLSVGGTGPRVRPITSCKGTVCPRGLIDTFALARKIHDRFYVGWHGVPLPGKFKIGVGGCPNNCIKPNLNDLGVTGTILPDGKRGYQIFLGGHWGRTGAAGTAVPVALGSEDEVLSFIDRTLSFYRDNGLAGERFFKTLARIGFDAVLKAIG